jgi:hypothetical protein
MRSVSILLIFYLVLFDSAIGLSQHSNNSDCAKTYNYSHPIPFNPNIYNAPIINSSVNIDGKLDDAVWNKAIWSKPFVDIEGLLRPNPSKLTKMKILWDDQYLYIGAYLEEDHLWYTLTNKDDIIFQDDDFEVFIDPDGDGHNYMEIEVNCYNAVWDLFLFYPYYMDKRRNYLMNWEAKGLKTAVHLEGTANEPGDLDKYWSVEIAIPWESVSPFSKTKKSPESGEYWRIDFSRVDWPMEVINDKYVKQKKDDGKNKAERNWVWSPTGYVNMHKPELWGFLVFQAKDSKDFELPQVEHFKWVLWQMYYSIKAYKQENGKYPENLNCITIPENNLGLEKTIFELISHPDGFNLYGKFEKQTYSLDQMGHIKKMTN